MTTMCIDTQDRAAAPLGQAARVSPSEGLAQIVARAWAAARHGMALFGAATLAAVVLLTIQPPLRAELEQAAAHWLLQRQAIEAAPRDADAERAALTEQRALPPEQMRMTDWLARKYRVAAEPLAMLVAEAHTVGRQLGLEPALLLAVMAQESRFNPFAASPMGAHGLMQVMTRMHEDKFEPHGGPLAAFDPLSNLRVGAQILHEAVRRAGSVPAGLRLYVGAVQLDGRDYALRVLSEQERLKRVAAGQRVPFNAAVPVPALSEPAPEADALEALMRQPVATAQPS
ncbi:MAG: lytic transglycosylase domain-containing protein [Tepidimonas sp.]|uniref:lytic transglycosylase domain-containing protein n=1 Tax=Tepidimonas sp. TaxID=2002775 RepID=UPI00259DE8FF|nr:lytic transglycosylase domain-containing protein [Tepidimonas sp.]MDM7457337.1 lytic transglycosylase domain-containing protein [Tepidimonas sp.]